MNPEQLETAYKLLLLMENDIKACLKQNDLVIGTTT